MGIMRTRPSVLVGWCLLLIAGGLLLSSTASAQQVQLTSPFHSLNDSFYENFGIGLSPIERTGRRGGWFFGGTQANSAPPPFGGYDPAADARFGFRVGPFGINGVAGQGSSRSHVMEAPTIVIPNGGTGSIFSGSLRPFVTGVVPIVGHAPMRPMVPMPTPVMTSPLAERLERLGGSEGMLAAQAAEFAAEERAARQQAARDRWGRPDAAQAPPERPSEDAPLVIRGGRSEDAPTTASRGSGGGASSTANHGDLSLREIRQQQAEQQAAREYEALVLIEKGRGKEAEGELGLAKIYYQQALSRADEGLRKQIEAKIHSMDD
jgi:hypothetical protein